MAAVFGTIQKRSAGRLRHRACTSLLALRFPKRIVTLTLLHLVVRVVSAFNSQTPCTLQNFRSWQPSMDSIIGWQCSPQILKDTHIPSLQALPFVLTVFECTLQVRSQWLDNMKELSTLSTAVNSKIFNASMLELMNRQTTNPFLPT